MSGLGCSRATLVVEGRRRCDDLATLGREKGKGMWPCDDYEWSEAGLVHGRAEKASDC